VSIEVDSSQTFQTIRGWEAVAWAPEDSPGFDIWIGPLLEHAVNEAGINRVQLQVRAGAEHTLDNWRLWRDGEIEYREWRRRRYATVNDNDAPDVIDWNGFHFSELDYQVDNFILPLKQLLAARGESLYVTLIYVAFTPQNESGTYHHLNPSEYSEFILAAFKHLEESRGFVPDALEILLEPENVPGWNESHMGEAIIAVTDRLHASGYAPDIIAPSVTKMSHAPRFVEVWAEEGGILDRVHTLSYHRYRGFSSRDLRRIAELAAEYNLETAMLEWWDSRNGYRTLHEDLKVGMNSAWQHGVLGGDSHMSIYLIDDSDQDKPVVSINSATKFTRQYFKYIRHGAKRVGADSSHRALDPLAFVGQDGAHVVVIKADTAAEFNIAGLPAGTYGVTYTTGPEDWGISQPDQTIADGQELSSSIPGEGVITVFAR
jgi:hypothetical protein